MLLLVVVKLHLMQVCYHVVTSIFLSMLAGCIVRHTFTGMIDLQRPSLFDCAAKCRPSLLVCHHVPTNLFYLKS